MSKLKEFLNKKPLKKNEDCSSKDSVKKILEDLEDKDSTPEVEQKEKKVSKDSSLNKAEGAPNTWFHHDHPTHGKIEVSAHVPKHIMPGPDAHKHVKIHGVGAPGDVHISHEEAGITPEEHENIQKEAYKHGHGNHMNKSQKNEYTANEIVLQALKNVASKQEEMKKSENTFKSNKLKEFLAKRGK
jgi:hypothetical protein